MTEGKGSRAAAGRMSSAAGGDGMAPPPFICLYLFILLTAVSCHQQKTDDSKAAISGQLSNASRIMIYFDRISESRQIAVDSAQTDSEGKFSMPNPANGLDYYVLRTADGNAAYLVLHGGEQVYITGDAKNLDRTCRADGSEDTRLLHQFKRHERHLSDSIRNIYISVRSENPLVKDSAGMALQQQYDSIMRRFALPFVSANRRSIVSLSASLYLDRVKDLPLYEELAQSLAAAYPGNVYVESFLKQLEQMRKLPLGSAAPEIALPSPEGKVIPLSSLLKNGASLVVIDFWASWCEPCRRDMPKLAEIYRKYKASGLEILGVSLDDNTDAWKKAISADRMVWKQVSDLKRWNGQTVAAYGIEDIPYTVLVDSQGKVVAKGLRLKELELKIRELLLKG